MIRFLFLLHLSSLCLFAQNLDKKNCNLLHTAVQSKEFKQCFYTADHLNIIDTGFYFSDCIFSIDSNNKALSISRKLLEYNPNKHKEMVSCSDIIVYKMESKNRSTYIYFWQPYSNKSLILSMRYPRNMGVKIRIAQEGVF